MPILNAHLPRTVSIAKGDGARLSLPVYCPASAGYLPEVFVDGVAVTVSLDPVELVNDGNAPIAGGLSSWNLVVVAQSPGVAKVTIILDRVWERDGPHKQTHIIEVQVA